MIDLELYYKIAEAKIRKKQVEYLKQIKSLPLPEKEKKGIFKRRKIPVEIKLLKGYNKGVEMALKVIKSEFKRYERRLKKEEKQGGKF